MEENNIREAKITEMDINEIDISDVTVKEKKGIELGILIFGGFFGAFLALAGCMKSHHRRQRYVKTLKPGELAKYDFKRRVGRYHRRMALLKIITSKKTKKTDGYRKMIKLFETLKPVRI